MFYLQDGAMECIKIRASHIFSDCNSFCMLFQFPCTIRFLRTIEANILLFFPTFLVSNNEIWL